MAHHWIATRPGDLNVFVFEEYDAPPPQQGEVTIEVRAAGMNPADAKHVARGDFPHGIGYEAVDVSLALVADRDLVVTIAAQGRAKADGFTALGGGIPASIAYRDSVRAELLNSQHPGGKLVLEP